jgi:CheY-like chemotaxis protein
MIVPLSQPTRSILLAEDDADDQELLSNALREIDPALDIICITNGRRFVSYLESVQDAELPSLIILDYNIPELTGVEILTIINEYERYVNIPKIVWSTSKSPVFKTMSFDMGVVDYVIKPNDIASFTEIARHMLSFIK